MRTHSRHRAPGSPSQSGLTIVEMMIFLAVILVAAQIMANTMVMTVRSRHIVRENAIAAQAAQNVFETMRAWDLALVYAAYNQDPGDDPPGAEGNRFPVPGLDPLPGTADGMIGTVVFPEMETAPGVWEIREDFDDRDLGMPRDLNGDLIIDADDHSGDYIILPVRIEVDWVGKSGRRHFELIGTLIDLPLVGG